jgi:hypothetical protein
MTIFSLVLQAVLGGSTLIFIGFVSAEIWLKIYPLKDDDA